jgi:hypothetical protein
MGALVGGDDVYIGSLFELFNLRFGVEQEEAELAAGGITEIKALQEEFEIFRKGRKFVESAKLLGLGGLQNNRAKNRWFKLLPGCRRYRRTRLAKAATSVSSTR